MRETPKPAAKWTADHERQLRAETERRFRQRTPPTQPDEVLAENRVMRSELRAWCTSELGAQMPETDPDWATAFGKWFRRMGRRIDPGARFAGPVAL